MAAHTCLTPPKQPPATARVDVCTSEIVHTCPVTVRSIATPPTAPARMPDSWTSDRVHTVTKLDIAIVDGWKRSGLHKEASGNSSNGKCPATYFTRVPVAEW